MGNVDGVPSATDASTAHILRVEDVSKVFDTDEGPLVALRRINLGIKEGEFVSFVGPSGCGKSTLLNAIAGLEPLTRGRVVFRGGEVSGPSRDIGMMFQNSVLFPWRTALENVLMPIEVFGWDKEKFRGRALQILDMVGLGEFTHSYPSQLSGGMQQRVALSRVLLYDPDVLLLDEPFGALDEFTRETMNLELLKIWGDTGKTVVLVTHNINEAVFLSDTVVVMTPRPGQVARVLQIDLPRPRQRDVMKLPRYSEAVFEVREVLGVA